VIWIKGDAHNGRRDRSGSGAVMEPGRNSDRSVGSFAGLEVSLEPLRLPLGPRPPGESCRAIEISDQRSSGLRHLIPKDVSAGRGAPAVTPGSFV